MSIGSTLPPQAYTREILAVAFNWLQGQPDSIRKLAVTPDALVGLYLRAQRFGQPEAPVSAQNFVSDLKNLAEGLKQFEAEDGSIHPMHPSHSMDAHIASQAARASTVTTEYTQRAVHVDHVAGASAFGSPMGSPMGSQMRASPPPSYASASIPPQHPTGPNGAPNFAAGPGAGYAAPRERAPAENDPNTVRLTEASRDMARDIRRQFHLSNETEAANMMIAVAYKTLQNLLR